MQFFLQRNHSEEHLGLWYTIKQAEFKKIFHLFCLNKQYNLLADTFDETSLMIRKPSLSVIKYIKQLNLKAMSPPKFIFYGAHGAGKTTSIAHVVHYLSREEYVIMQVPFIDRWLKQFLKKPSEIVPSSRNSELWDQPTDASDWLKYFLTQNKEVLTKLNLVTSEEYQFSTREQFAAGSELVKIIELGVSRPRLASHIVCAVASELKRHATQGNCKVAVVLDGINSMFTEDSIYKIDHVDFYTKDTWKYIPAQSFSLVQTFIDLLKNDWKNGVIVGSVDYYIRREDRGQYIPHPRHLLGPEV